MRALLMTLALLLPLGAMAQDTDTQAARREAARQLVEAANVDQMLSDTLIAMRGQIINSLQRNLPNLSPAQITAAVDDILMPEFQARRGEVIAAISELYAERLSVEELRYAAAFYAHPTGQRLLRLMPEISARSAQLGSVWGERVANEAFAKHREALRARGLNL